MTGRVELRKEYKEQTGEYWKTLNPTAQPTIEYVKWLESKLIAIHNDVGQGEQYCEHPEDKIWYNDKKQMQCTECGEEF